MRYVHREPIHDLLAVLVEGPCSALAESFRMRAAVLGEELYRSTRERFWQVFIVLPAKIPQSTLFFASNPV